jgi:hypothetical protein
MNGTSPILTEIYFKECVGFRNGNGNQDWFSETWKVNFGEKRESIKRRLHLAASGWGQHLT